MSEMETLKEKNKKLKQLMLLTDESVSDIIVGETQLLQWSEFISAFPDEGEN